MRKPAEGRPPAEPVVLIPPQMRQGLMADVHNAGHQGSRGCLAQLRRYCFWRGMYEDVEQYIAKCPRCLAAKPGKKIKRVDQPIVTTDRFDFIQLGY